MAFIAFYEDNLADGKAKLMEMRLIGREDFSREFQIWTSCRVVCRPTEKEAKGRCGWPPAGAVIL
jgi:hypothetical protein